MPPQEQKQQTQAALRRTSRQRNLKLQQEALRKGEPVAKLKAEKRREEARRERQRKLKSRAKEVEQKIKEAGTPVAAKNILSKLPKEVKQFIDVSVEEVRKQRRQRFQKRIEQLKEREKNERERVEEFEDRLSETDDEGKQKFYERRIADTIGDAEGVQAEIRELKKLQGKEDVPFDKAKDFADDVGRAKAKEEEVEAKRRRKLRNIGLDYSARQKLEKGQVGKLDLSQQQLKSLEKEGFVELQDRQKRQFTPEEQEKISAWMRKNKQTPSREKIQEIISKPKVKAKEQRELQQFLKGDDFKITGIQPGKKKTLTTKETKDLDFFESTLGGLEKAKSKVETAKARGKLEDVPIGTKIKGGFPGSVASSLLRGVEFGVEAARKPVKTGKELAGAGKFLFTGVTKPGSFEALTLGSMKAQAGQTLRSRPTATFAQIGAEAALGKGISKVAGTSSRLAGRITTRLSPRFRKFGTAGIKLSDEPGDILRGTEKVKEPIPSQLSRAGGTARPVSSLQDFFGRFRGTRTIKKPLGIDETKLSSRAKTILNKIDEGETPSVQEIKLLDQEVKKLQKAAGKKSPKGIRERAFFADPEGRFRPRRMGLGEQKRASFLDFQAGDFTFKKSKPQILAFGDQPVEQFPQRLRPIVQKIKQGKKLTPDEEAQLIQFQLKPSGQFKPLGFQTPESEVLGAPSEIIRKTGKKYKTLIQGRKVRIYRAGLGKVDDKTKNIVRKINKGEDISPSENRYLKKQTGVDYYSDIKPARSPRVSPGRVTSPFVGAAVTGTSSRLNKLTQSDKSAIGSFPSRKTGVTPSVSSRVTSAKGISSVTGFDSSISPPSKPSKSPTTVTTSLSPTSRPPKKKPKKIPKRVPFDLPEKERPKQKPSKKSYNVILNGKKVSGVNLPKEQAKNYGFFVTDQTPAKQFKLKKSQKPPKQQGFSFPSDYGRRYGYKFTKSKRKNVYKEGKQYRKDRAGEYQKRVRLDLITGAGKKQFFPFKSPQKKKKTKKKSRKKK